MSARRAAEEAKRIAELRKFKNIWEERIYRQIRTPTSFWERDYKANGKAADEDELEPFLDSVFHGMRHLPRQPFHRMRHVPPSKIKFQEREGFQFRSWLQYINESKKKLALDLHSMNVDPPSYPGQVDANEKPEYILNEKEYEYFRDHEL